MTQDERREIERQSQQQAMRIFKEQRAAGVTGPVTVNVKTMGFYQTIKAAVDARMGDYTMVYWGKDKCALMASVVKADASEAPKRKNAAETGPSKKQLMIKGSKWRLTQDIDVLCWVENPEYWNLVHKLNAQNIMGQPRMDALEKLGRTVQVVGAKLKAGTEITIDGKFVQDWAGASLTAGSDKKKSNGLGVPLRMTTGENAFEKIIPANAGLTYIGDAKRYGAETVFLSPYREVEAFLEPMGELKEQFIYLLRDRETGLYYKTTNHEYFDFWNNPAWKEWLAKRTKAVPQPQRDVRLGQGQWQAIWDKFLADQEAWEKTNPSPRYGEYRVVPGQEPFTMVEKISQAKQHTDMGKVKQTILNFTAYYSGIEMDPDTPEWRDGGSDEDARPYPLPPTFEAVKYEKFSKKEIETIDVQEWYARTLRLRTLTKTFGGSVRSLYNTAEKAGKLDDFAYVVSFRSKDEEGIQSNEITAIDEAIEQLDLKKVVKKAKDGFAVSVMVPNFGAAVGLKMAIDGMQTGIIELKTMTEMVDTGEANV